MYRKEFGVNKKYCVRYDAFETKVDVVGSLSVEELDSLIEELIDARAMREDKE